MAGGSISWRGKDLERALVAVGVLAVIATFLPYYGAKITMEGVDLSYSVNAWHSYAILGDLLLVAAVVVAAVRAYAPLQLPPQLSGAGPVGGYGLTAALAGLGTLLVFARAVSTPHIDGALAPGISFGIQWGGYLLFLLGIAETALAVLAARQLDHPMAPAVAAGPV